MLLRPVHQYSLAIGQRDAIKYMFNERSPETSIRPSLAFQYAVNLEFEYDYEVFNGENIYIYIYLLIHWSENLNWIVFIANCNT